MDFSIRNKHSNLTAKIGKRRKTKFGWIDSPGFVFDKKKGKKAPQCYAFSLEKFLLKLKTKYIKKVKIVYVNTP